jgi:hypothetical protein
MSRGEFIGALLRIAKSTPASVIAAAAAAQNNKDGRAHPPILPILLRHKAVRFNYSTSDND